MKKKALFIINSLGNGGAERVCINLAKELIQKNYKVDFIILYDDKDINEYYTIKEDVEVYNLKIKSKNKLIKLIEIIIKTYRFNTIIKLNEKNKKYDLITSHLPISNLLTRFSCIKNRAIYVFHTTVSYYGNKKNIIFKNIFKNIFNNVKIVTVSDGIRNECIKDFELDDKYIQTIYNPINLKEIEYLSREPISFDDDYILQVGRFIPEKRQDRMIEIFLKR